MFSNQNLSSSALKEETPYPFITIYKYPPMCYTIEYFRVHLHYRCNSPNLCNVFVLQMYSHQGANFMVIYRMY